LLEKKNNVSTVSSPEVVLDEVLTFTSDIESKRIAVKSHRPFVIPLNICKKHCAHICTKGSSL